jgi:hypothetical protein
MKASRILLLCSAVTLPQFAMAEMPSPQALGIVQAVLNYCAQVDPKEAALYQAQWKLVVGKASLQQVNSVEATAGYKQGYDLISGQLAKIDQQDAAKTCAAGVATKKEKEDSRHPTNGQAARPRR